MNAIDLLKADHKVVLDLLEQLSATTERALKKRVELIDKLELELFAHTHIEEEIFYPAYKKAGSKEEAKMYFEAIEEHRAVDALVLPHLKRTAPGSVEFSGRAKVLKELLEHHIEEEEETLFKQAKSLLSAAQLKELGTQMEARKLQLKAELQQQRKAA
ncbi:hemerythrin domain-containing protein [Pseudomonas sp. GV071]|jgi:hemerythrin-like domain-containing protein|uniref:hemerythrin domain-containing protein n=1 Tax=Pseudomonas sp. GV071 TaxID=2135754 RepID=UPI000D36C49B|nr:hemerythrin domain-containing protein [Pseudomonas sp. GV071]PTQ68496.1 hemerythrin HHE cation binding domain-containing protein [Pseudomonas sp. GV071]